MDNNCADTNKPISENHIIEIMNKGFDYQDSRDQMVEDRIHKGFKKTGPDKYKYDTETKSESKSLSIAIVSGAVSFCSFSVKSYEYGYALLGFALFFLIYYYLCRDFFEIDLASKKIVLTKITLFNAARKFLAAFSDIKSITLTYKLKTIHNFGVKFYYLQLELNNNQKIIFSNLVTVSRYEDILAQARLWSQIFDAELIVQN
jgi:hypothetical protein